MAATVDQVVRPVIVKKVYEAPHAAHHGGAWKVAYADFVTAMMAFFLLMWLLGATTEKQRKALADYFAPTLVKTKQESAGSNGMFGGDSIVSADHYPHRAAQTGTKAITIPRDAKGGRKEASGKERDKARFEKLKQALAKKMQASRELRRLAKNVRFTETREGLRIDLVDEADFSMFVSGTNQMTPDAMRLLDEVSLLVRELPNGLIIRGHTDAAPYARGQGMNNWKLSAERAEITRAIFAQKGVGPDRFLRIEGVADREPYVPKNRFDPRNRRMSITLGWGRE
ncbi:flagellar motor protein MotB [Sphingorhabdus pulchriflava]|uniref:Flagellar motor protein MotB n=1 Tax=Sphingorhabdus pulchriflava TaxID=2292257 RepID=A0A371B513_9SPHN|nr:flagellar motor protein MotB [Sphingorhabdus pulchriflava]RDV02660.1 flagellar motor protein MotB [Sphingorhabdus pulchriflava]